MPELFLYFRDRDSNISRMQLHTADFIYPAELTTAVEYLQSVIAGISDAVFINAQFVRVTDNLDYIDGTGYGIAEKTALIVGTDIAENWVTIILPSPKDSIWSITGAMPGVIATPEVISTVQLALAELPIVSEYNEAIVIEGLTVVKAL